MGDIRFNYVPNLKCIYDVNYDKVVGFKDKVFENESHKVDYDKYTYAWLEVRDEIIDGMENDRSNRIDITYNNVYLYDKKRAAYKKVWQR